MFETLVVIAFLIYVAVLVSARVRPRLASAQRHVYARPPELRLSHFCDFCCAPQPTACRFCPECADAMEDALAEDGPAGTVVTYSVPRLRGPSAYELASEVCDN